MTTLTITDAKKNLTKWLKIAASGGEVAIICGADIVALRKVPVQAADYAMIEYGLTAQEVAAYEEKAATNHAQLKRKGAIDYLTTDDLVKKREKASRR